ncbi:MAG: aspartate--tRNA ligase [Candidatus Aminicenantes bacterium]|jgi:aspartyl-tRNA synthetase
MKSSGQKQWRRTHYCGELRTEHVGEEVVLLGWVNRQRDIGNLVFIDIRDREGIAQVVFSREHKHLLEAARKVRMEDVAAVKGIVRERAEKMKNPHLATGGIEVEAKEFEVLQPSEVPPFIVTDPPQAQEELRFKYRYIDLRRPSMQRNLKLRHHAALRARNYMNDQGFYEIETPFLTKSTPEGARDYLVPSRVYKGRFFAMPQSPQIFKQLLMIAGFDRYFQIVRCFRDEDLRADRQPEFTQIDVEMSFVESTDVFRVIEGLMAKIFELIGIDVEIPFPHLTYGESMSRYGTDKPDLRLKLEIVDLKDVGSQIDSEIINKALSEGGELKGLVLPGRGDLSRSQLDRLNEKAKEIGAKGVIWIKKPDEFKSSLKIDTSELKRVWEFCEAGDGDLVLLVADRRDVALRVCGAIRQDFVAQQVEGKEMYTFAWVTDFPLFEWSEEEGRLVSMHHPFTSPVEEDIPFLEEEPQRVRAKAYDLVLNGVEIGGGSIRINDLDLQRVIFKTLGLSADEAEEKFGFFLEALRYGAPQHGGIALGFDRIVMLLAGEETIRDVIPFPKTTSSLCLLTNSPSEVDDKQLETLGLKKIKS